MKSLNGEYRTPLLIWSSLSSEILDSDGRYLLHPAILDACLHVTGHKAFHGDFNPSTYYLPAHVEALVLHQPSQVSFFPAHIYAHIILKAWSPCECSLLLTVCLRTYFHPASICYDINIVNNWGEPLCTMRGLQVAKHHINPQSIIASPFEIALQGAPPSATTTADSSSPTRRLTTAHCDVVCKVSARPTCKWTRG